MPRSAARLLFACLALVAAGASARSDGAPPGGEPVSFKTEYRPYLIRSVTELRATQDPATGRFGTGIWIVTDQNALFPLAVAWSLPGDDNPHYHDPALLEAIMDGGDALIEAQDARGMWVFRKKDDSTWGDIYMPWTYSRWVRAYLIIKDAMPPERRERWEKALTLGYEGISRTALTRPINIPAHHAMGLYHAGIAFDRPDWKRQATAFMRKVAAAQHPDGYWTEHSGPVVAYNSVYVDALGTYYAVSGDRAVLPALERSARFHAHLTYPDGSAVETVDERNPYSGAIVVPNHGFTHSDLGRGYLRNQWARRKAKSDAMSADLAASYLMYAADGPAAPAPSVVKESLFTLGDNAAGVLRASPWCAALSAYTSPFVQNRWIQDRQNFVSLFHERTGLIVGGGNTRLQPLWSTFTVGDTSLLSHKAGDENPDFKAPPGLRHVPVKAALDPESSTLTLDYGPAKLRVQVRPVTESGAQLVYSVLRRDGGAAIEAHVPLIPRLGGRWETASGRSGVLGDDPVRLGPGEAGAWFSHAGWRIRLPDGARVDWPALPHNPYVKDGAAKTAEGRIVVSVPLPEGVDEQAVTVLILPAAAKG